jgi:hypothetical protein
MREYAEEISRDHIRKSKPEPVEDEEGAPPKGRIRRRIGPVQLARKVRR